MTVDGEAHGPLRGIRILEFSQIVAGPVAGLNLADLGADVIKIEPMSGDSHRFVGTTVPGESKMYQGNNRGKRGMVVDLQDARGLALIHCLVPTVDAVVINFRPGVPERLGIDYETLRAIRPDLIYAQISGFGETGLAARKAGSDIVAQAHSGLMAINGKLDEAGSPQVMGVPVSDYTAGLAIAMAVCAALYHRSLTGEGQYISTSLLRVGLHLQNRFVMREPVSDSAMRDVKMAEIEAARARGESFAEVLKLRDPRGGFASPFTLYYRAYQTKDGAVVLGALTPQNRQASRKVLGIEGDHSDEPDFDAQLQANIDATLAWKHWIEEKMLTRSADEWVELMEDAGVPVARVNLPEEMSDDPLVAADGMILDLEHTVTGPQRVVGPTVMMSATPTGSSLAAPAFGEHTAEILRSLGVADAEIQELGDAGVVRCL